MTTETEATETQPPTVPHVLTAWRAVIAAMAHDGIAKKSRNSDQGYNFRGIDDVLNALASAYAEHGLIVRAAYSHRVPEERATKSGGRLVYVTLRGTYTLVSLVDGSEYAAGTFIGEAMDTADKATNKAMSAAYKYMAIQTFAIPVVGEENDADKTTPDVAPRDNAQPRQAPQQRQQSNEAPQGDDVFKFGRAKGKRFSEGTDRDLEWYREAVGKSVDDPAKAQYKERGLQVIAALDAEIIRRQGGQP